MTNTSKKQISLAVLAVVFATAMIASIIATSDNAFARSSNKISSQSIGQSCSQNQKSAVVTAGAVSPSFFSGNNFGLCANFNSGGNALSQ